MSIRFLWVPHEFGYPTDTVPAMETEAASAILPAALSRTEEARALARALDTPTDRLDAWSALLSADPDLAELAFDAAARRDPRINRRQFSELFSEPDAPPTSTVQIPELLRHVGALLVDPSEILHSNAYNRIVATPGHRPEPIPLDSSDDLAYDLIEAFFTDAAAFRSVLGILADSELILRSETAARLSWHFKRCLDTFVAANTHLGLFEPSDLRLYFAKRTNEAVYDRLGVICPDYSGEDVTDALTELSSVALSPEHQSFRLFLGSGGSTTVRLAALAGQVAAMRSALEL